MALAERVKKVCPQCGNDQDNPRPDSIERLLVCGDSFHDAEPKPTPSTPAGEVKRTCQHISSLQAWNCEICQATRMEPQPDSSSISTDDFDVVLVNRAQEYGEMAREHKQKEEYDAALTCEDKRSGLFVAAQMYRKWAAAKGSTDPEGKV